MDKTEMMFKELTEANGISGFEDEVADLMASYVSDVATVTHDKLGSLVAEKKGKSDSPRVMIAGHMSITGKSVQDKNRIRFIIVRFAVCFVCDIHRSERVSRFQYKGIFLARKREFLFFYKSD